MNLLMLILTALMALLGLSVSLVHSIRAIVLGNWDWGMITLYVIAALFCCLFRIQYKEFKQAKSHENSIKVAES